MSHDHETAELETEIERFGRAWAAGDAATLAQLLAPDYSHVDVAGAILGRETWLAYARCRAGSGTSIGLRDTAIRRHGDIAIVTGVNVLRGTGIRTEDDPRDLTIRFTQVWIREDGHWLREAFQGTAIEEDAYD